MPYYKTIKDITPRKVRRRLLSGLHRLRSQLESELPEKTRDSTLILGTWNIRNFDDNRFMNGYRTDEDLLYIAEIIARFDIIAVQEICDDISALDRLMFFLGKDYDYVITDVTEGKSGNDERLGFIFDRSKVSFQGMAGELVLPDNMQIVSGGQKRQFARTPFMCSFQSGWFKFIFSTVHIYFGSPSGEKYATRVKEITEVARFLAKRAKKDNKNHILVGDFNIVEPGSLGFNALEENGFQVFQNKTGSNRDQTKYYDQISFRVRENELRIVDSDKSTGVLQFFNSIFREQDFRSFRTDLAGAIKDKISNIEEEIEELKIKISRSDSQSAKNNYKNKIKSKRKDISEWKSCLNNDKKLKDYYLGEWRTFHASDHLPLWTEFEIDFSDTYLDYLRDI